MVLQQVDLVDVRETAVGAGQQARLEGLDALRPARAPGPARQPPGLRWRPVAGRPPAPGSGRLLSGKQRRCAKCLRLLRSAQRIRRPGTTARWRPGRRPNGQPTTGALSAAAPPARVPRSICPHPRSPMHQHAADAAGQWLTPASPVSFHPVRRLLKKEGHLSCPVK